MERASVSGQVKDMVAHVYNHGMTVGRVVPATTPNLGTITPNLGIDDAEGGCTTDSCNGAQQTRVAKTAATVAKTATANDRPDIKPDIKPDNVSNMSSKVANPKGNVANRQTANDRQEGGTHYKNMPIEVWDFIVANKIPYLEGNCIKYIVRWKLKGGIQDLLKAKHYLDKLIEVSK